MGKVYSEDLRLCVLSALDGGMSKMTAHRTFQMSRSTIDDWLALREQTGAVSARSYRRGPAPAIADLTIFETFASHHRGCTLVQMAQAWQQESGQHLSNVTLGKALRRLGWTRKKRVFATRSGARRNARPLPSS